MIKVEWSHPLITKHFTVKIYNLTSVSKNTPLKFPNRCLAWNYPSYALKSYIFMEQGVKMAIISYVLSLKDNNGYTVSSPCGQRVKPDTLISIHGLSPGSFPHFLKPENILNGVDKRVHGSKGSTMTSHILYFHATG